MFSAIISALGPLRLLLALLTVVVSCSAPFAEVSSEIVAGWAIWPRVIAPALMPILLFVIPLDITMSRVMMSGKPISLRGRYRMIITVQIILLIVLLLAWLPFLFTLFSQ